ncbi:hypothetical protein ACJMK2_006221 [Sinanodonta woodiana]|uniref:cGMP-dependent protein kinase n=1 Tax=Sinanodonta woodiana TaxID=1069815 RepID=A0ABD3VSG9_SINWO
MKSKSMRFRWISNLKKWVVNNLCCVVRKKNIKRQRSNDLESSVEDKSCEVTACSAIDLSTITSADLPSSRHADLETEMSRLKLDDLNIVTPLGVGGFGRVILVQENCYSNETYALKILNKQHIVAIGEQARVLNERDIMVELRSDFIVRLHKTFKDDEHLYMLMEPCLGGELFTLLSEGKYLSHTAAKFYTACVAEAFSFMHSKGIVHRDLKPENVLLDSKGYAKLIDFGIAKKVIPGNKTQTLCGTPNYVAPEILLRKGHDTSADIWSLGVLVFAMLSGRALFADKQDNDMNTCNNILKGLNGFFFPIEIEDIAEHFIRKLCRKNPVKRLTAQEIPKHGWFNGFQWEDLRSRTMEPPFIPTVESSVDTRNFDCEGFPEEADYPHVDDAISWDPDF